MHKVGRKCKIGCFVFIMIWGLVSCAPSASESIVEGTVSEENNIAQTESEESSTVSQETEEISDVLSEIVPPEMYSVQVGLNYVEKPKKRTRAEAIEKIEELSIQFPKLSFVVENEALYPDGLLTSLAENPEMTDFICGYPDADGSVTGGFTEQELEQEYPLFLQFDPRWGYYPYGISVMAESGCGPTCLSMALLYLTGDETITPDAVGQYSMDNGYYVTNVGTAWALLDEYPKLHGLSSNVISVSDENMKQELEEGNILICSMRPGEFTSGGHFVVVYGTDEEGYRVNDPKCVYRSNRSWSYEELATDIKRLWCIGKVSEKSGSSISARRD